MERPTRWCSGTCSATAAFPVRATVSDLGPLLLGRLFNLNATQQGVLALVFKIADDTGLLLLDLKDLRAMLQFVGDNASEFTNEVRQRLEPRRSAPSSGRSSKSSSRAATSSSASRCSTSTILLQTDAKGRGIVNVLVADELIRPPKLYATFLLWMLSELFERLPEVGDPEKPTLVFFFDEAHLLFTDAPPALIEKVEQVVRLIRSKGVGVYFVTQSPSDVPDTVLGQLGNRVQHALRAFTPHDQKAVKTAAQTLRPNPGSTSSGDHGAGRRRGAGVAARREGQPHDDRARVDRAARVADRTDHRRRTRRDPQSGRGRYGRLRAGNRPRVGLRKAQGPH